MLDQRIVLPAPIQILVIDDYVTNGRIKMEVVEKIKRLCCKFPTFSASRLPYTYHHDMMRTTFPEKYESRASVAADFRGYDDEHLYLVAFLYLVSNADGKEMLDIFSDAELKEMRELLILANKELFS